MRSATPEPKLPRFYPRLAWLFVFLCLPALVGARCASGQTVPIRDESRMMLVPVHGFNRTLYFILDTGFTVSAIDTAYQSALGNQVDDYAAVSPLGQKNVPVYSCPGLSLAGQPLGLSKIVSLDLTMIRQITGEPCDGILGSDWLARHVVAVDFDKKTLTIEADITESARPWIQTSRWT